MKFNWKIGGEAGFGIMTTGAIISKIATRSGYHIFNYAEYPSLIRGGHNTVEVILSDEEITAPKWDIDMLVCLNKDTYDFHKHRLHAKSVVIYDPDLYEVDIECIKVPIRLKKIKTENEIHQQLVNTIAVAASLAILGGERKMYEEIIVQEFSRKGQQIVDFNLKLVNIGFEAVQQLQIESLQLLSPKSERPEKMVMAANDAFSIATVAADCKYYAAYPMTPASSVLTTLAAWQYTNGMIVRHVEDEIAVINGALGASYGGVRSAVGTSGGGFALMVESLSYAGVAEIPIVAYLGMRPGPATGMPTWTEQGDLLFAVHAGHGEFPKIVLTPGDIEEMIELGIKAYDLADVYQTPVIVTSDKHIGESGQDVLLETVQKLITQHTPNRGKIVSQTVQNPYLRYKLEEDGISEMLIPGQKDIFYQANSYEHIEDSHTTEDAQARIDQVNKRAKKMDVYLKKVTSSDPRITGNIFFEPPKYFGHEDADIIFVSWGGMKGIILETQKLLEKEHNTKTGYLHFTHVYPMDETLVQAAFQKDKRYILVENNSQAQFGQLLRMQTGIHLTEKLLKYDGRQFWPEEIVEYIFPKSYPKLTEAENGVLEKIKNSMNG
ncbi:MAG TPA: 2-oxoacid:acceptor oxidoreductase subunit alpha [Candidatus Woesebacteria bacterium]|nr:2-oxoacid:acceptor oxidoreductase subunit alpha [Candidatus Woesebacteria bacterium]